MDLALAKGLEFDHVVVADAQAEVYPDTPLARRRLYTAVSRAMHRVTVLAQGELTPLLSTYLNAQ
jgi:DNA helicase-2/ATP-dependent DNA helicase PcrA